MAGLGDLREVVDKWEGRINTLSSLLTYSKYYGNGKRKSVAKYYIVLETRKDIVDILQVVTSSELEKLLT